MAKHAAHESKSRASSASSDRANRKRSTEKRAREENARRKYRMLRGPIAWATLLTAMIILLAGPADAVQNAVAQNGSIPIDGNGGANSSESDNFIIGGPEPVGPEELSRMAIEPLDKVMKGPEEWTSPEGMNSTIQVMLLLTVLSLAPAILLMTTCFVRIVVVLGLLRQAIGTQQLPPSQVITTLSLFLSLLIMSPVWKAVYSDAIKPYTDKEISIEEAWDNGIKPIRQFMSRQIYLAQNSEDVLLFMKYLPKDQQPEKPPETFDDVPLTALLPAFMLSELKTAFLIGFQIYLPFLILDMVIASVMVSMGMLMLPPVIISFPFKLLLFVLVDGWTLVVSMLMQSIQPFT